MTMRATSVQVVQPWIFFDFSKNPRFYFFGQGVNKFQELIQELIEMHIAVAAFWQVCALQTCQIHMPCGFLPIFYLFVDLLADEQVIRMKWAFVRVWQVCKQAVIKPANN
jgi:hypothetical protein